MSGVLLVLTDPDKTLIEVGFCTVNALKTCTLVQRTGVLSGPVSYYYLPLIVFLGVVVQAATTSLGAPKVRFELVPKEQLKLRPQTRNHPTEYLRRLADSLLLGQLQPGGCLKDFMVIWGNGRVMAAQMEPKITHVWMAVLDEEISEKEFRRRQGVENFVANPLSNAEKCKIAVEYAKSEPSMTLKQIAGDLGVDPSMLTRWMAWERCIDLVQQALECDSITLQAMYSLSQLPINEQETALANYLNPKKAVKRNGSSVSRLKCQMPSGTVVSFAGESVALETIEKTLVSLLKEVREGQKQGLEPKTFERVLREKSRAS